MTDNKTKTSKTLYFKTVGKYGHMYNAANQKLPFNKIVGMTDFANGYFCVKDEDRGYFYVAKNGRVFKNKATKQILLFDHVTPFKKYGAVASLKGNDKAHMNFIDLDGNINHDRQFALVDEKDQSNLLPILIPQINQAYLNCELNQIYIMDRISRKHLELLEATQTEIISQEDIDQPNKYLQLLEKNPCIVNQLPVEFIEKNLEQVKHAILKYTTLSFKNYAHDYKTTSTNFRESLFVIKQNLLIANSRLSNLCKANNIDFNFDEVALFNKNHFFPLDFSDNYYKTTYDLMNNRLVRHSPKHYNDRLIGKRKKVDTSKQNVKQSNSDITTNKDECPTQDNIITQTK